MNITIKRMWFRIAAIVAVAAAVTAGVVGIVIKRSTGPDLITAQRGTIIAEVIVTGKTKPVRDVDLAFERGGRVAEVRAAVGDRVAVGAMLAAIDSSGLAAELAEAEANLAVDRARLANAELALEDVRRAMLDKLQDAYTKSDDAVRNRTDQFVSNGRSASPQLNFAADPGLENAIETERVGIEAILTAWPSALAKIAATADLEAATSVAKEDLRRVGAFLSQAALALGGLRPNAALTQATIDAWRADVSTARTNVSAAQANVSSAEEKLRSAPGDVAARKAEIAAREARIQTIRVEISKTTLRAPIAGIVTRQDAAAGEIVAANTTVISIISAQGFEIEANIPEVDIGSVRIANPVRITLDAFPLEALPGRVARIDPAETIVDGVVNFRVGVAFEAGDPRLKSGLTANLAIETARKEDALLLPQFAIVENDRGTFVRLTGDGAAREVPVGIGIRGQDGMVEIVSGLAESDRVENVGRRSDRE